ncbi:MAG: glycosyltransferase family 4 protein [Saprospiraceae bacterium]
MRILFLTDNFPPESNAPATRTYEHCKEWVEQGAEVTVITCVPNYPKGEVYPGYKNKWRQEEVIDGIRVIRVWSFISPNRGLFRRILDYVSFCVTAFFASLFVKTDVIIATSPQLFTAVAGYLSSFFKRKPWILEVRDLWPESIKAVDAMEESLLLRLIDQLVLFLYRKANRVVVVTESFKERIHKCGVPNKNIHVVKNGVYLHKFQTKNKDEQLLDQYPQLKNKFVVAYVGTHGMAHNLDFILDCAASLQNDKIHFLFVGEGAMKGRLLSKVEQLRMKNVTMLDGVPKSEVPRYLSLEDVALIPLKKRDTFKKVLPSKIFENAAMQKPILLGVEGEAKAVVEAYNAGQCFEPESKIDFLEKLNILFSDKLVYQKHKEGCITLAKAFDRKRLALKMYDVIDSLLVSHTKTEFALNAIKPALEEED